MAKSKTMPGEALIVIVEDGSFCGGPVGAEDRKLSDLGILWLVSKPLRARRPNR